MAESVFTVTQPSKTPEIIELTFDTAPSISGQLRTLLPTIEHYRTAGRSLKKIHSALISGGHLSCSWRTFEKTYYRIRKQPQSSAQSSIEPAQALTPTADSPRPKRDIAKALKSFDMEAHQAIARAEFARNRPS